MKRIGIIIRNFKENNKNFIGTKEDLFKTLYKYDVILIGIPINNNFIKTKLLIDECDGIILSGGSKFIEEDFKLIKYLYNKNIPTLGICLGMQGIARCFSNDSEVDVINHNLTNNNGHYVIINKQSLLYKIIKTTKIFVNSRHNTAVKTTKLFVSAKSEDGIIEGIEDNTKKFFMGFQWHPESLGDKYSNKIFNYFIKKCK